MASRRGGSALAASWLRGMKVLGRQVRRLSQPAKAAPPAGTWLPGLVIGAAGARRYWLYKPPGLRLAERPPLVVMLHGCGQDAESFARSTRMNRLAARERVMVLYPEQDRLANPQGCWNWFDTRHGRAQGESDLILAAIDQACRLHRADPSRVALAGLSAGASLAALLASRHPERFRAVVMHSGIAPGAASSPLSALGAMRGRRDLPAAAADGMAWPPLLVVHGMADRVVVPSNGQDAAEQWAGQVGARASPPRRLQRGQRRPCTVTDFKRGRHLAATLVLVDGMGHAWSGGAAGQAFSDPFGPDGSRMAWAFMRRQFALTGKLPTGPGSATSKVLAKAGRHAEAQPLAKPKPKPKLRGEPAEEPAAKAGVKAKPKTWPYRLGRHRLASSGHAAICCPCFLFCCWRC